jgi:yecA family protein
MTELTHTSLSDLLSRAGAETCASEFHGFLCGQLCAAESADEDLWVELLDLQTRDDVLAERCYAEARRLAVGVDSDLRSQDFSFRLLLPDEDSDLAERVDALGEWCHGFLNGFGLVEGRAGAELDEDCRELLDDFSVICRVSAGEPEDGDEEHLFQVVEYVRVGVMTIYEEYRRGQDERRSAEVLH